MYKFYGDGVHKAIEKYSCVPSVFTKQRNRLIFHLGCLAAQLNEPEMNLITQGHIVTSVLAGLLQPRVCVCRMPDGHSQVNIPKQVNSRPDRCTDKV